MYDVDPRAKLEYLAKAVVALLVIVIAYATGFFIWGSPFFIPSGIMFAVTLVWVLGHVGGFIAVQSRIPALLGMLIIGIIFENIPGLRISLSGFNHSWQSKIKAFGLATILLRAGLKINYTLAFRQAPWTVLLLGILPVFAEGFLDTAVFCTIYGMTFYFGAMAGFLLSAISPTVVVTGMLDLQKRGYGSDQHVPSVGMAAAGMDVACGVCMFSIFESLALSQASGTDSVWPLARGPASIGIGVVASLVGGVICGCTKLFTSPASRSAMVFSLGQMFMFLINTYYQMPGGGALAAIGTGGVAAVCWQFGFPGVLSLGPSDSYRTQADEHLALFWMYVMQPLLFCTIGVSVNFQNISGILIPKALLVIVVGSFTRILSAFLSALPSGWGHRVILFVSLSWIPKATIQGALSSQPLEAIQAELQGTPNYQVYYGWGNDILATAVLAILVTAPLGLLMINLGGPKLLPKTKGKDLSGSLRRPKMLTLRRYSDHLGPAGGAVPFLDGTTGGAIRSASMHEFQVKVEAPPKEEVDFAEVTERASEREDLGKSRIFGLGMDAAAGLRRQRNVGVQVDAQKMPFYGKDDHSVIVVSSAPFTTDQGGAGPCSSPQRGAVGTGSGGSGPGSSSSQGLEAGTAFGHGSGGDNGNGSQSKGQGAHSHAAVRDGGRRQGDGNDGRGGSGVARAAGAGGAMEAGTAQGSFELPPSRLFELPGYTEQS